MGKKELTTKQLSSVHCPTCSVAAEQRCVLNSGAPRSEPHVDGSFPRLSLTRETKGKRSPPEASLDEVRKEW